MFRSCFESLASVVTIKLVRAAHCGAPRIAVRTWAVVGKNDWQFSNPRIDTACISLTTFSLSSHLLPTRWIENEAAVHCHQMDHVNQINRYICSGLASNAIALPLRTPHAE